MHTLQFEFLLGHGVIAIDIPQEHVLPVGPVAHVAISDTDPPPK